MFGHLFKDMDLLMAIALQPHFKLPVVAYFCQQDSSPMDDVKRRLIKELVNIVKESQMVPDFQETVQMDADEADDLALLNKIRHENASSSWVCWPGPFCSYSD